MDWILVEDECVCVDPVYLLCVSLLWCDYSVMPVLHMIMTDWSRKLKQ